MRRLSTWLPPLLYMAVIFAISSQPNPLPELTQRVWDKLLHAIEYGVLAALLVRAFARQGFRRLGALAAAIVVTGLYGASDEYHQRFVPGRNADVRDWGADSVGSVAGAVVYAFGSRRVFKSEV